MADRDLLLRAARMALGERPTPVEDRDRKAAAIVDRLLSERGPVVALPVLRTCGQCADCYPPSKQTVADARPATCSRGFRVGGRSVDRDGPPPSWCPLRGER